MAMRAELAVSQLFPLRLESTTAISCESEGKAHWHDVYLGNLVSHSVLACSLLSLARFCVIMYGIHYLLLHNPLTPELLISLKTKSSCEL